MSGCCSPQGYRRIFSERRARNEARRYRRRGLDVTSRRILDALKREGLEQRTLLEVGGGIGALQIELVRAGVASAISIELTPTYEDVARELLAEAGLQDRVERRLMDFADGAASVPAADIVIMNRVICCYPDMPKLAGAAADHAREVLVLSFPKRSWWVYAGLTTANIVLRVFGQQFQVFLHRPKAILAVAQRHGLRAAHTSRGLVWQVATLRRASEQVPASS